MVSVNIVDRGYTPRFIGCRRFFFFFFPINFGRLVGGSSCLCMSFFSVGVYLSDPVSCRCEKKWDLIDDDGGGGSVVSGQDSQRGVVLSTTLAIDTCIMVGGQGIYWTAFSRPC